MRKGNKLQVWGESYIKGTMVDEQVLPAPEVGALVSRVGDQRPTFPQTGPGGATPTACR